ncbi:MAG: ADP-ribose pyrophosphatase [Candidatus Parcubacteria bacterium]|jgi:mutator protein MutT
MFGMEKLKDTTLIFLVRRNGGKITELCLAMKKRGFGVGRYNGVGGKLEAGETIESAGKREAKEEIGVEVMHLNKVAELTFRFAHTPAWNQLVHVYTVDEWVGEPTESEEMRPEWFVVADIPFDKMWPDDRFWFPHMLTGKLVRGEFTFGEGDTILNKNVTTVATL